jgi:hypothetical protein
MRDAVQHAALGPVDGDLAAAAQPQPRTQLADLLAGRLRLAQLGRDGVFRRVRPDLDEQVGGGVEAPQAYPVGAERNVVPVYVPVNGLAAWPVVEQGASAYPQSSLVRLEGAI